MPCLKVGKKTTSFKTDTFAIFHQYENLINSWAGLINCTTKVFDCIFVTRYKFLSKQEGLSYDEFNFRSVHHDKTTYIWVSLTHLDECSLNCDKCHEVFH